MQRVSDRPGLLLTKDTPLLVVKLLYRSLDVIQRAEQLERLPGNLAAVIGPRVGTDTALARVVKVFGAARPHHAYLFANKRATRLKVLVYDGFGIWLAARRLNQGHRTKKRLQTGSYIGAL